MATYKKRGYKPQNKEEREEQVEDQSTTAEVFNSLDEGANKTEEFVAKNQNIILIVIGVIAVVVLGYLAYERFVVAPNEEAATNEMYQAQSYFDDALIAPSTTKDSLFNLALNGGEGKYGFLDIADEYSSTDAGNLANYYAGMAFLNTGKYKEAISSLEDFSSDDLILAPLAKGAIGDAFLQLNQAEEALGYYESAASMNANEFTTPKFLLKAGITAIELGKADAAVKHLTELKDKYATSTEASQVAVYLGQAKAMQN
jgi:TolA-binding protein